MNDTTIVEAFVFPLSFGQQRLWFLEQLAPGSSAYNVPAALRLTGDLNVEALELSLQEIVQRHEILRTTIGTLDGQPVQIINPDMTVTLPLTDLSDIPEEERAVVVQQLAAEELRSPFDLARGPLLRPLLLRLDTDEYVLLVTMHHIVTDGWSVGVFSRELATLYTGFCNQSPAQLPGLPIQYADFAVWQRESLTGEVLDTHLAYWKQQLAGATGVTTLPPDCPHPPVRSLAGACHPFVLPKELTEELRSLSRREGVTLFMTLLGTFQVVLHHLGGDDDMVVGTDVANRNCLETENLIGFFANQLVLRTNLSGNPSFQEILQRVRDVTLGAYTHQDLPFDRLVEELRPDRQVNYSPLFQVKFVLQNAPRMTLNLPRLALRPMDIDPGTAKFELLLNVLETEQELLGLFQYSTDLFSAPTIARMLEHYQHVLQEICARPSASLKALEQTLSEADRERALLKERQLDEANQQMLAKIRRKTVAGISKENRI